MNAQPLRNKLIPIFLLITALVALVVMVALMAEIRFRTRGIPKKLPEPIAYGGVRIGVNTNLEQYSEQELVQTIRELNDLGFQTIKQSFVFDQDYDWNHSDRIIRAVSDSGIQLVPLLDGNPDDDYAPPEDLSAFASWAGEFSRRYGDVIDYYIIWDEPNLSEHWGGGHVNAAEYAALLTASAAEIRDVDPGAAIIAAPLAPTTEEGPENINEADFLNDLYKAGAQDAFDIVSGKPYGFDSEPGDRTVNGDKLNFSRIILLRELMEANGDAGKAIWAGNWGWNSLPEEWQGAPSIWGQVEESIRARWVVEAIDRARKEWPWMGAMFIENWEPSVPNSDPHWGFAIRGTNTAEELAKIDFDDGIAFPGYQLADQQSPSLSFSGDWRFSPDFGADIGQSGDSVNYRFWGTDAGLRVRRANFHGRFYITIDGEPPNALPRDENGSTLVINSPGPEEDYLAIETIATGLAPGEHEMTIEAHRGTGQWALNGFSAAYRPPTKNLALAAVAMGLFSLVLLGLAIWTGRQIRWREVTRPIQATFDRLDHRLQLGITALVALIVSLMGWLTWGEQVAGLYRRLGDGGQLALTAATASVFYLAPSFILYILALVLLFGLIYLRPAWGLAIIAFSFPFFVNPKSLLGYQFSPVEIFLLVTLFAFAARWFLNRIAKNRDSRIHNDSFRLIPADFAVLIFAIVATVSLLFTERLNVATNEWRVVIIEPIILYGLMRLIHIRDREMWTILDAFVLGGVVVAAIGLGQYVTGQNLITSEGGLMRLRSIYGSPNNVALYLGRVIPILVAYVLMGAGRRRAYYSIALVITGVALLLTFSKGSLFLGLPAALLVVFFYWRLAAGGRLWPWLVGAAAVGVIAVLSITQIPQLAGRLNPQGATGFLRLNLWRSSWNMFRDHPVIGVGLDNFLYEYRGRYLMDAAWKEPNLNHPHNIFFDFATRLGLAGLAAGIFLFWSYARVVYKLPRTLTSNWRPIAIGLIAVLVYIVVHGLVDHSLFLVDLSFVFFFLLAIGVWLQERQRSAATPVD
jgi:O-antigen ligase